MKQVKPDYQEVTVAMITKDEEVAVAKVIRDIQKAVPKAEILIVDSSKDKTPHIAQKFRAKVIRQFPPQGYGRAMLTALESASGKIVVTLDCDDTYPTEKIPELVSLIYQGYDLVNTTRILKKPKAMPWQNFLGNRLFAWMAGLVHGIKTTDLHSGMRAYRKEIFENLILNPARSALPVELYLLPFRLGYRCYELSIEYRERIGQTTLYPWETVAWTLKRIWYLRHPQKFVRSPKKKK